MQMSARRRDWRSAYEQARTQEHPGTLRVANQHVQRAVATGITHRGHPGRQRPLGVLDGRNDAFLIGGRLMHGQRLLVARIRAELQVAMAIDQAGHQRGVAVVHNLRVARQRTSRARIGDEAIAHHDLGVVARIRPRAVNERGSTQDQIGHRFKARRHGRAQYLSRPPERLLGRQARDLPPSRVGPSALSLDQRPGR